MGIRVAEHFTDLGDGAALQAPAVFTLSQWVADRAVHIDLLNGVATPHAPDPFQVLQLWDAAIRDSLPHIPAEERFALAQHAREAERLLNQWGMDSRGFPESGGWRRFRDWRSSVREAMRRLNWHTTENWMLRLIGQLQGNGFPKGILPQSLRLAGFVELTGLETKLIEALRSAGVTVTIEPPPTLDCNSTHRQCFESVDQEISAAAYWAEQEIKQGRQRVAVIVNGLGGSADRVRTIFENQLQPEMVLALHEFDDATFHITTGSPLTGNPLVCDALMLLDMVVAGVRTLHEFPRISRLLLSPNWSGGTEERFARAMLELSLRKAGYYRWSLAKVTERATSSPHVQSLRKLIARLNGLGSRDAALHPAQQLLKWLIDWGWPGDRPCAGASANAQARLLAVLESLSRQSFSGIEDCLLRLQRACGEGATPGPGGVFSPIQVMAPEEAFGLRFDAAWMMNFIMENWPGRPAGSPFLPADLLKRIPRATEDGMLDYAERLTRALLACAPEVRFSWCKRLDDMPISVSPLIADLPEVIPEAVPRGTLWRALAPRVVEIRGYRGHPWLVPCEPEQGRALETLPDQQLRGAVTLLNYQSACPLAAYLAYRLGAHTQATPQPFTDAAYRGELVHAALEQLYRRYRGSHQRPDASDLSQAVNGAMESCSAEQWLLPAELSAVRSSLEGLLQAWLDFENGWPGGYVAALEWRKSLDFRDFSADVRIDRVDRLEDGRVFLLDYKTGSPPGLPAWAEERLGDVQLPYYAVLMAEAGGLQPAGIAMASVRLDGMKFVGLTDDDASVTGGISGFKESPGKLAKQLNSWEEALEQWRAKLAGLLAEVRAGDCRHQLFKPEALKYAGLDILMRSEEGRRWCLETEDHGSR